MPNAARTEYTVEVDDNDTSAVDLRHSPDRTAITVHPCTERVDISIHSVTTQPAAAAELCP